MAPDRDKAMMLAARARRRCPGPPPRWAQVAAQLSMMGLAQGGAAAVALRDIARPKAPWRAFAPSYWRMSREDWRGWHRAAGELQALGVNAGEVAPLIANWTDETLNLHAPSVARVAVVLARRGRLTGPELDRLLAPVTAEAGPLARLIALAERIITDPDLAWPLVATAYGGLAPLSRAASSTRGEDPVTEGTMTP